MLTPVCSSVGWAAAVAAMLAFGSACHSQVLQSRGTSDSTCGNLEQQGLSLTRF